MKVPHAYVPRTQPSSQGLGYLNVSPSAAAFGAGVADALSGLGAEFEVHAEKARQKNEKTKDFQALQALSAFETEVVEKVTELKRDAPEDLTNFANQVEPVYSKMEQDFLSNQIPVELQEEFRTRAASIKQRVILDSLEFQYTQQDAFFRVGIDAEYKKAQVALEQSPDEYQAWSERMAETIMATDLSATEKSELARKINGGLVAVVYAKQIEAAAHETAPTGSMEEMAADILRSEEGFIDYAKFDVNALRTGYGSDTTTRADGSVERVVEGTKVSRADAERDLARRIQEFKVTASGQVGAENWAALPLNVQAALVSVTYNYGELPNDVLTAIRTGDMERVATAVEGLSANPERRAREAAIIRNASEAGLLAVEGDPKFEVLSLEDRQAIRSGAFAKVKAEQEAAEAAAKEQMAAARNSLYIQLHDGVGGPALIAAARKIPGLLDDDIEHLEKAESIWADYLKRTESTSTFNDILSSEAPLYNPATHNKIFNDWIGEKGLQSVASMDQEYFNNVVIPSSSKVRDLPSDLVGQLLGMTRSTNAEHQKFAYDNLVLLQEQVPEGFGSRVDTDLARNVSLYRTAKGSVADEELFNHLRGGLTPQERAAAKSLDEEAVEILKDQGNLLSIATDMNKKWNSEVGNWPAVQVEIEREYADLFRFAFRGTRDPASAKQLALEMLDHEWDTTKIGGEGRIAMKFPPNAVYPRLGKPGMFGEFSDDGFEPYEDQIRAGGVIADDETFQLVTDNTTISEVEAYRRGELNRLPSYAVIKFTTNGDRIYLTQRWHGVADAVD